MRGGAGGQARLLEFSNINKSTLKYIDINNYSEKVEKAKDCKTLMVNGWVVWLAKILKH